MGFMKGENMSKSARSLFFYGIYIAALGAILICVPNILLKLLFFPETSEVWIRVIGVPLIVLAYYDIQAARIEDVAFFKWSVQIRIIPAFIFAAFVLLGFAGPQLLLFGVMELLGSLWTGLTLRSGRKIPETA
jgi:hypothetical protein